ncbi:MAG: restriction endonuclease subunit M, partial [Actinobacteria bacterium]|nr:restriction endonuclease subunit M [Actinomycetota bacterium]
MFDSITNRAEFFSDHYLNARLKADLGPLRAAWDTAEGRDLPTARVGLRSAPRPFFAARAAAFEAAQSATSTSGRTRRDDALRSLHDVVLHALGFGAATSGSDVDAGRATLELSRAGGTDTLVVSAAAHVRTPTGLLLVALDCGLATDVDELFDDGAVDTGAAGVGADGDLFEAGLLISPLHRDGGQHVVAVAADAPGELFSTDDPPRFVLLVAGTVVLLAERSKWAEGRFLAVDLDAAFERADTTRGGELDTIAALFSADALVPGHLDADGDAASVIDGFIDASQKHAVGVSKELRDGMRRSVEILGDEVRRQRYAETQRRHDRRYAGERVDPKELRLQCLRYLYRLIVLLYAESRPELGVLPVGDDAYRAGYSLDRLRDLVLVELTDDHARNGHHFQDSLDLLFGLVNRGNHAEHAQLSLLAAAQDDGSGSDPVRSHEDYLEFPGLDATIFDPAATPLLDDVTLRNEVLQQVLSLLMLSPGRKRDDQAGFISYAELGINQLGAVYEGLMAYTGFFATEDLFEVAKGGDPSDGTWMVPLADADAYPDDVFVTRTDADTGVTERVRHPEGSFVYRLAGRDRQRSASYYTPEVLTQCVVRHALAELLGIDDHARVPGGSAGITRAEQILELTVCEPALGSGAFLNEAINQLAAEYLRRRQAELDEVLDAERYQRELQKVKAHFALHQCYGVDLNATAVELAEVSLWLNSMHPGLKAPWFGLQLRRGNSLIGARRATWSVEQLFGKDPGGGVWARARSTDTKPVVPPTDRPLSGPLPDGHVHHFLLPGHGWGAVSGRKEAKELAPDAAKALAEWRKAVLKAPNQTHTDRLVALANGVERLWAEATDVLDALHRRMRRPLGLYGTDGDAGAPDDDRRTAEAILANRDSALGRLRLVMDAWVGLWFWPLDDPAGDDPDGDDPTDDSSDGGSARVAPPSWAEWLTALEAIVGPEPTTPTGQLDLFADLAELERIESARSAERGSVDDVLAQHPWLARAQSLARAEGAWHWELEFAPVFRSGGFDLQVGNPPWVRPRWDDDLTLAESDPWWGITDKAAESVKKSRRAELLERADVRSTYLTEVASAEGVVSTLGSAQLRPVLSGVQTNLYMVFMDTVWRHGSERGMTGLLHPESHFVDPEAGQLRADAYGRLRRHWQFVNESGLFEIHNMVIYGVNVYGSATPPEFRQMSNLLVPATADSSIDHDGTGAAPGIKTPDGDWDLRPHLERLVTVDLDVLSDWARLF